MLHFPAIIKDEYYSTSLTLLAETENEIENLPSSSRTTTSGTASVVHYLLLLLLVLLAKTPQPECHRWKHLYNIETVSRDSTI